MASILLGSGTSINDSYAAFRQTADLYGAKAAGLLRIPTAWCPPFVLLPVEIFRLWKQENALQLGPLEAAVRQWFEQTNSYAAAGYIARSSGKTERMEDRGLYKSVRFDSAHDLERCILEIYESGISQNQDEQFGIVLQAYVEGLTAGHLSNETRVSPTRNQWTFEAESPLWQPARGLNSKFAIMPDPSSPLVVRPGFPAPLLRSVGKWATENVLPRCHIEWVASQNSMWLVQLDAEWAQEDQGVDPALLESSSAAVAMPDALHSLKRHVIGQPTPWRKLQNLANFDFTENTPGPILFQLTGEEFAKCLAASEDLRPELDAVTGGRMVVRVDCLDPRIEPTNLPRTDTVSAQQAVQFMRRVLSQFEQKKVRACDIAYLVHGFIPARASAWAYARPDSPIAIVDALWGLPDGLQVLPCDSFEVDVVRGKVLAEHVRYKPRFLAEDMAGRWAYRNVLRSVARAKSLGRNDVIEIGQRTALVAQKLASEAQIMWFCEIPLEAGLGRNLPWFRAREIADASPRAESAARRVTVRNFGDIERLPDGDIVLVLSPDVDLIREETFLQTVIDTALARRLPVELEGSILGHAYYRLSTAGVVVTSKDVPKYKRTRGRRVFGKLVRDLVPEVITAGGENVAIAELARPDMKAGLAAKMLEELEELVLASTGQEEISELADVLEVVRGLAHFQGVKWDELVNAADKKREKRGGFELRKVLLETSLPMATANAPTERVMRIEDLARAEQLVDGVRVPAAALILAISQGPRVWSLPDLDLQITLCFEKGDLVVRVGPTSDVTDGKQLSFL
jgi:predicted house-cleaning noncanonical NTP pyrophosphatase (MazG superfamily)